MTDLNTPSFPTNQDLNPVRLRQAFGIFRSGVVAGDHTIVLLRLHGVRHADHSLPLVFHRSAFGLRGEP